MDSSPSHPLKALMIFVTQQCNLCCDYCYITKNPSRMSPETAFQAVNFLLSHSDPKTRKADLCFFGGEPLMESNLIKHTCDYAKIEGDNEGIEVSFSMTTNGTLVDDDRLSLILKNNIDTTISIDGHKNIHDQHRKTTSGAGSFELIEQNLQRLLQIPKTTIRLTVSPDSVHELKNSVQSMFEMGFNKVNVAPVFDANWDEQSLSEYFDQWDAIYCQYDQSIPNNQQVGNIDRLHTNLQSDGCKKYGCGAARNMVAVDPQGNLYPCHRYIGYFKNESSKRLGHVNTGFNEIKRTDYISSNLTENHLNCGIGLSMTQSTQPRKSAQSAHCRGPAADPVSL